MSELSPKFVSVTSTSGPRRLFCLDILPSAYNNATARSRAAVLICQGFAEELNRSRYALVAAGQALADAGFVARIFDYSGCGDSEGELDQVSWEDWRQETAAMAEELKNRFQRPVYGLGLRLGALLLDQAQADSPCLAGLLHLAPVGDGQTYLKRWLRPLAVTNPQAFEQMKGLDAPIDFAAYRLSQGFVTALAAQRRQGTGANQVCLEADGAKGRWPFWRQDKPLNVSAWQDAILKTLERLHEHR